MKTRLLFALLCVAILPLLSGCAVMESAGAFAVDAGQTEMRARDYRDQGFSNRGADRNAFYDQTWDSH